MSHSVIKLNLFNLSYAALLTLAQAVHDGFVLFVAVYAAPNPAMLLFQTHVTALKDAITAWGPKGARGSHTQHLALIAAANVVRDDLRMLVTYAMNTKPNAPDSWAALGFSIKRAKSLPSVLQMVQNLRNFVTRDLVLGTIKLKWERPLETDPGDVKVYIIQYNNVNEKPDIDGSRGIANVIGLATDTSIVITPPYTGANYFWVTPFNSVGYGVSSDPLYYNSPGKP
jgi:hypothetical protein